MPIPSTIVVEIVSTEIVLAAPQEPGESTMNTVFETRFARIGEAGIHYRTERIRSSDDAKRFARTALMPYFEDKQNQEEMLVITLTTQHQPIRIVRVTRGTLDASLVHPREIFNIAVTDCAHSLILAHNHPSGDPTPSPEDIKLTARLVECGNMMGIRILDHLIVGDDVVSLADRGCM